MSLTRDFIFRCPDCGDERLIPGPDELVCAICNRHFPVTNGKFFFGGFDSYMAGDTTDNLKGKFKSNGRLYSFIVDAISPVYPLARGEIRRFLQGFDSSQLILNLGAGNSRVADDVINLDFMPYTNVTIVADLTQLPFPDNSIDGIINIAVLEHVLDPGRCVEEFFRVLKPGGRGLLLIPFIQGFHASPHDYQRFTKSGLLHLLRSFNVRRITSVGPTSGLLWVLSEWLGLAFSFGIPRLQSVLSLIFMVITSPLKWFDFVLRHFSGADNITTAFIVEVEK